MIAMKLLPALFLLAPGIALAQPESADTGFDHAVPAVANAWEIGVSAGFSQGFGRFGDAMQTFEDYGILGPTLELGLGYRWLPELSVGAYGSFTGYYRGTTADELSLDIMYGARAGVQAVLHLRPTRSIDPWLSLGTGWTGVWISPPGGGGRGSFQGLDLARFQIGVDYRLSKSIAIAPVLSGGFTTFLAEDYTMPEFTEIHGKTVQFAAFAGLAGRFDLVGAR